MAGDGLLYVSYVSDDNDSHSLCSKNSRFLSIVILPVDR